jgi:hypothetical protein
MEARLVVCWFNMVAIELLVEFQLAKSIWNSAARRYDIVQTVDKMSFDRENTSRSQH